MAVGATVIAEVGARAVALGSSTARFALDLPVAGGAVSGGVLGATTALGRDAALIGGALLGALLLLGLARRERDELPTSPSLRVLVSPA